MLDEEFSRTVGHVGYVLRPSARGKGYGKAILRLGLEECRRLGLDRVLLTCDETNAASRGVILANGGTYESTVDVPDGPGKERYWIGTERADRT